MRHLSMLLRIARRSLVRNRRRTLLAALAIGIGIAALMFTDALFIGMTDSMVRTATDTFLGHGQIHRDEYRTTLEVSDTIIDRDALVRKLASDPEVSVYAERTQAFAMIASPANVASILLTGVDPRAEAVVSELNDAVVEGSYFGGDGGGTVLIGDRLASALEAGIGDQVIVTTAEAHTGELAQELFRVGGIFRFGIREMDDGMAFMQLPDSQKLLNLGTDVHEIAVRFPSTRHADHATAFWSRHSSGGNEALLWSDLVPQLSAAIQMGDFSVMIVAAILFGIVALGIMNTLFMSLYERMFEFGVLRAVGTRPLSMALMIVFEAATLAAVSIVVGLAIGLASIWLVSKVGISYIGIEYAEITFRERIYPVLRATQFTRFPLWVFGFTLMAALYPAFYAARLTPVKAMRRSF